MECFELVGHLSLVTTVDTKLMVDGGDAVSALGVSRHSPSTDHYYSRDYNIHKTA